MNSLAPAPAAGRAPVKALVIDDEEAIRRNLRSSLEDLGYVVETAANGREALEWCERAVFDIVLVDLAMPVMGGLETIAALREMTPLTPLVVVSGSGVLADAIEAIRLGAWDYVAKPVANSEELELVIQRNLDRSRLLLENQLQKAQLERLLAEKTSRLAESEERLRVLSDNLPDSVVYQVMREPDGRMHFLHLSAGLRRLNGLCPEAVRQDSSLFFDQVIEEDRAIVLDARDASVKSLSVFNVNVRMRRADGALRWMNLCSAPRGLPGGRVVWDGIETDITERKRHDEQYRQAQKLEALGTLAGGIAHDFNNILAAIISFAEQAKMDNPDNLDLQENLQQILGASTRATHLVRQILSFSRQHPPERKTVQIAPIIQEVVRLLRATLPSTIELRPEIAAGLPDVLADPNQIHQVIMNLCANAAHAVGNAPGRVCVGLDALRVVETDPKPCAELRPGHFLRLSVSDTGHGMENQTLKRIFEPFFTTKRPGEGTGLGLAVVHGIVTDHDGLIAVESAPGQGTTFTIFLPALTSAEPRKSENDGEIPRGNGERIFFVDDEPALCSIALRTLRRLGYVARVFNRPDQALQAIEMEPAACDVLVTDLTMPLITGVELARQVLKLRPNLPIILTSGYAGTLTLDEIHQLGIRDLVYKPLDFQSFAVAINNALTPR